ncbi:MAG: HAD-IB family hydrolase [Myxococcales bacterium]|nr:HAD-IB family hydrolase [Myxococcales bacterium]MCB9643019.1 HAD-IB family hydrolase [Myxococcales bacterium]
MTLQSTKTEPASVQKEASPSNIAAFFDLDRTLIQVNSGTLYVKHEFRKGRISLWTTLQAFWYLMLYHFSMIDMDKVLKKAIEGYKGDRDEDLRSSTHQWFAQEVTQYIQPGAQIALDTHKELGHPRVLLTSSSCYAAEFAKQVWELDDWLANRFALDQEGRLNGEFDGPLCHGHGKVIWAEKWAKENDIDLDNSYFYTDSLTDLPMLERVRNPRVVNPDPRLRREALRRGWPILDWQDPKDGAKWIAS